MSPEQLMGKQLDGRSDVYALGVLGYELLTGRLPFPDAKGPAALITAQLKQTPKPPSAVNPQAQLPPGVDRVILKMLEKDKNQRFADVGALAAAAQECIATGRWGDPPAPAPAPADLHGQPMAPPNRPQPMPMAMAMPPQPMPQPVAPPPVMPPQQPLPMPGAPQQPYNYPPTAPVAAARANRTLLFIAIGVVVAIGAGVGLAFAL